MFALVVISTFPSDKGFYEVQVVCDELSPVSCGEGYQPKIFTVIYRHISPPWHLSFFLPCIFSLFLYFLFIPPSPSLSLMLSPLPLTLILSHSLCLSITLFLSLSPTLLSLSPCPSLQWRTWKGMMAVQRGPTWCLRTFSKYWRRRTIPAPLSSPNSWGGGAQGWN